MRRGVTMRRGVVPTENLKRDMTISREPRRADIDVTTSRRLATEASSRLRAMIAAVCGDPPFGSTLLPFHDGQAPTSMTMPHSSVADRDDKLGQLTSASSNGGPSMRELRR